MRFFEKLSSVFRVKSSIDKTLDLFRQIYGGFKSTSNQDVNWQTSLQVTTVLACVRVVAEGIAQVPLQIFKKDGTTRLPATDHPLYYVLNIDPNPWQTSFEYRETVVLHTMLTGNHYSYINRVFGKIVELIPLRPEWVTVYRDLQGEVTYKVTMPNGEFRELTSEEIWHVRGLSWDYDQALSPIKMAREAIGLALATEEHHAKLHANGAKPSGLLSVAEKLNEVQEKTMRKWLQDNLEGAANAFTTVIMDRGATWTPLAPTGVDAQHLETRRYQVEEICRAMRVMPIMVGYSDKAATYASAEQMFLAHLVHTLSPWYMRFEQSINKNLLGKEDLLKGYYSDFDEKSLLRGAMLDTATYLTKLKDGGVITGNEARDELNMNPSSTPGMDETSKINTPADTGKKPQDPAKTPQ